MEAMIYTGLLAVTWLFVAGAGSIQFIKGLLKIDNEAKPKKLWHQLLRELVNCSMCTGFWVGLFYYGINGYDHYFLIACLVSIGSIIFTGIMNIIFDRWLNNL